LYFIVKDSKNSNNRILNEYSNILNESIYLPVHYCVQVKIGKIPKIINYGYCEGVIYYRSHGIVCVQEISQVPRWNVDLWDESGINILKELEMPEGRFAIINFKYSIDCDFDPPYRAEHNYFKIKILEHSIVGKAEIVNGKFQKIQSNIK
jgi:hypothetical protein